MHAYLLVGSDQEKIEKKVAAISKKLKAERFEFKLQKIADTRELADFTKIKTNKRVILIRRVDQATKEALNAFLKNLEEPNEAISYILTAVSRHTVLPTILSRCLVINVGTSKIDRELIKKTRHFLDLSENERLVHVEAIRQREKAIDLMENFIRSGHQLIHEPDAKTPSLSVFLRKATLTLKNLKANGNVSLQLTNFVVNL